MPKSSACSTSVQAQNLHRFPDVEPDHYHAALSFCLDQVVRTSDIMPEQDGAQA